MSTMSPLEREIATLIVSCLELEDVSAEEIDPDAPLFREGLGLDSIDALELSLAIAKQYGVQLQSNDETDREAFRSLRALSAYVEQKRNGCN